MDAAGGACLQAIVSSSDALVAEARDKGCRVPIDHRLQAGSSMENQTVFNFSRDKEGRCIIPAKSLMDVFTIPQSGNFPGVREKPVVGFTSL